MVLRTPSISCGGAVRRRGEPLGYNPNMRTYGLPLAALTLLAVVFPTHEEQTFPLPGQPLTVDGYTTIRSTDPHTIEVTVDDPEQEARHLFHLWSNETLPAIDCSFPRAHLELTEKVLRVVANGGGEVITLALSSAPPHAESAPKSTRYTGYGLQHETVN
jgi:hypothetical protein